MQESEQFEQLDLFTDYQERAKEKLKEDEALSKERKLQDVYKRQHSRRPEPRLTRQQSGYSLIINT